MHEQKAKGYLIEPYTPGRQEHKSKHEQKQVQIQESDTSQTPFETKSKSQSMTYYQLGKLIERTEIKLYTIPYQPPGQTPQSLFICMAFSSQSNRHS